MVVDVGVLGFGNAVVKVLLLSGSTLVVDGVDTGSVADTARP